MQGREVKGDPLPEPDPDRHGIPEQELGDCVRCNFQLEGSGARPEDVLMDAGKGYENGPSPAPARRQRPGRSAWRRPRARDSCYAKHVVLRTDRSDGFVGRNFLVRGALKSTASTPRRPTAILLDKVKFFWAADYGHLRFTTDHNLVSNCDGFGAGDAVVYPGAAPQTGEFRDESFYPEQRVSTPSIKKCDLHGSALAYSGSMGNSVRVTHNDIYGNTNGLTDTLSAPGHPGFPPDATKVDHNWIYSNNLNVYTEDRPFEPYVPHARSAPGSSGRDERRRVHKNQFFDNWRQGTVLVADPRRGRRRGRGQHRPRDRMRDVGRRARPRATTATTTTRWGQVPHGFKLPKARRQVRQRHRPLDSADELPNGVDFWWDEFPGNTEQLLV